LHFVTERLEITDVEVEDVDGLLAVASSNPEFTGDHEGSGDESREAVAALVDWARAGAARALRVGVDEGNTSGAAFWQRLGFVVVDHRDRVGPAGAVGVTVLELPLE
jgi:hypothetical protein